MSDVNNFQLSKYYDQDGTEVPKEKAKEDTQKKVKQISVGIVGKDKASGFVAKALIKALKRTDLEVLEVETEPKNTIFTNIKVVSTEGINDPDFDASSIKEGDVVLTDMILPGTLREKMFRADLDDKNVKVFTNPEAAKDKVLSDDGFITDADMNDVNKPDNDVELQPEETGDPLLAGKDVLYEDKRVKLVYDKQSDKYITIGG